MYIRPSVDVLDISWTSYVGSVYFLCPGDQVFWICESLIYYWWTLLTYYAESDFHYYFTHCETFVITWLIVNLSAITHLTNLFRNLVGLFLAVPFKFLLVSRNPSDDFVRVIKKKYMGEVAFKDRFRTHSNIYNRFQITWENCCALDEVLTFNQK